MSGPLKPWWRKSTPSCSPEELTAIITEPGNGYYELPTDPFNEVYDNIFVGDGTTALCTSVLKKLGVTHVLNAACGKDKSLSLINTNQSFYRDSGIKFLGVEAYDITGFHLYPFFEDAAEFINDAIQRQGKVYVHCRMGISRSATLVLAYLIMKRGLTAQEAVREVRKRREIIPNRGFLKQLCELNELILKKRTEELNSTRKLIAGSRFGSSPQIAVV